MNTEPTTHTTPLDQLIEMEEYNASKDDRGALLQILRETIHFLLTNKNSNSEALYWGVLYSLYDGEALTISTRERAKQLGISSGLISHYKKAFEKEVLGV